MKKYQIISILTLFVAYFVLLSSCKNTVEDNNIVTKQPLVDTAGITNDFFDNSPLKKIEIKSIKIEGEVEKEQIINLANLPVHTVLITDAKIEDTTFVGAYKYSGYSLHDILSNVLIKKKNLKKFKPNVDLYVEIINDKGESVLFSWGEIFYPTDRHKVLIANKVMRIVPNKTNEKWELPNESKVIAACDLFSERNISNPTKIIVRSIDVLYKVNREIKMHADTIIMKENDVIFSKITEMPANIQKQKMPSVFYGKGSGYHGFQEFEGVYLKDFLSGHFKINKKNIQTGMFVIASVDGYRASFTFSEIMNRNDNKNFLIVEKDNYERAGEFSLFCVSDFFSDRAIKSINEIRQISM